MSAQTSSIARPYDSTTLEYKVQNKVSLQEELGWAAEPKRAMICIPTGVSEQLGGKLLTELLPGLLELPVELLILGKGSAEYGKMLTEIAKEHRHRVAIVPNDTKHIARMYAASDMALFLSDPQGMEELTAALKFGTVPVTPQALGVHDYNPNQESGNSFVYTKATVWHCFAALVRALETFRFPYDWKTIQRECMDGSK